MLYLHIEPSQTWSNHTIMITNQ